MKDLYFFVRNWHFNVKLILLKILNNYLYVKVSRRPVSTYSTHVEIVENIENSVVNGNSTKVYIIENYDFPVVYF